MNKQYVGNDFTKSQNTDKLTPEKVRHSPLLNLLFLVCVRDAVDITSSPLHLFRVYVSYTISAVSSYPCIRWTYIWLCSSRLPLSAPCNSLVLFYPHTNSRQHYNDKVDAAADLNMPLCMKVTNATPRILYCTVLDCTVLYYTVLYCTILY